MNKRSILYGYQIKNGVLEIVAEEQAVVQQVFERYRAGGSYQSISEELNQEGIPFSLEAPRWNKHKVKRVLEEVRYTGEKDYPPLIDQRTFQAIQEQIKNKTAHSHRGSQSRSRQRLGATACRQNPQEYQTDKPFELFFEKENINTLTESSEFLITLFSGFAQAESESLSKNVSWGIRKGMESGKVHFQNVMG